MHADTPSNVYEKLGDDSSLLRHLIVGERVTLRGPKAEDAPELFRTYFGDVECSRFLARSPHTTSQQTARLLTKLGMSLIAQQGDIFAWAIECRKTSRAVGIVTCVPETKSRSIQIHYGLAKKNWGRGLATEAVLLATTELLQSTRFDRIFTICAAEHASSRSVLAKVGFQLEAHVHQAFSLPAQGGRPCDGVRYALLRSRAW